MLRDVAAASSTRKQMMITSGPPNLPTARCNEYKRHSNQHPSTRTHTPLSLGYRQTTPPARGRYAPSAFLWGHRLAPQASDRHRPRLVGYLREDQSGKPAAKTCPAPFGFAARLRSHPTKMVPTRVKIGLWRLLRGGVWLV